MKKILVLSIPPVNIDSNNTFEQLFSALKNKYELYFVFCKDGNVKTSTFKDNVYNLSEKAAIKSIANRHIDCFRKSSENGNKEADFYQKKIIFRNFLRFIRDILWKLSNWKKSSFKEFLISQKFDYIVAPSEASHYFLNILEFAVKTSGAKLIFYNWDDNITYKQNQISPLFYLYRFITRKKLKLLNKYAFKHLSISDFTKFDVDLFFKCDSTVIQKLIYLNENKLLDNKNVGNSTLKIIYAGNLLNGREKTIINVAKTLQKPPFINNYEMNIYSDNTSIKKISNKINYKNIHIYKTISHDNLIKEEANSSIALLCEGMSFRKRKISRLSVSTKFIDYISAGTAIIAYNDKLSATSYIISKEKIGYICESTKELSNILNAVLLNRNIIKDAEKNIKDLCQTTYNPSLIIEKIEKIFD